MENINYRKGRPEDDSFMKKMLYEAVFWNDPKDKMSMDELFKINDINKILLNWGRNGDYSLIAEDSHQNPVGVIWYRFWTNDNPSYGFVDSSIPEMGIAIIRKYRGKGIGTALINAAMNHARDIGVKKMSLSVEEHNPSRKLYSRLGFRKIKHIGNSWTMVAAL